MCVTSVAHTFLNFEEDVKMANVFSGNQEKKIPKSFKDCYKTDSITKNLWLWCERLEKFGQIFAIFVLIAIIIVAFALLIDSGDGWIFLLFLIAAPLSAFLEYISFHILALLIGSLATIVQHTKITANITLYNSAKIEGASDDYEEECEEEPKETVEKKKSVTKTNKIPNGFKKCTYCKKLSPIETERCSCGCLVFETCAKTGDGSLSS